MIGNSYNLIFLYLFSVLVFPTQSRRTDLQSRTHSAVSYTKFADVNLYYVIFVSGLLGICWGIFSISVRYDKFFSQHYMQVSVFLFRLGNPPISESTAAAQAVCLTRCDGWNIISSSQISARQLSVYGLRVVGCNVFFIILPNPKLDSIYLWLFCKRNDNNPCYCYYCLFFLFESCSDTVLKLIGGLRPKRLRLFG